MSRQEPIENKRMLHVIGPPLELFSRRPQVLELTLSSEIQHSLQGREREFIDGLSQDFTKQEGGWFKEIDPQKGGIFFEASTTEGCGIHRFLVTERGVHELSMLCVPPFALAPEERAYWIALMSSAKLFHRVSGNSIGGHIVSIEDPNYENFLIFNPPSEEEQWVREELKSGPSFSLPESGWRYFPYCDPEVEPQTVVAATYSPVPFISDLRLFVGEDGSIHTFDKSITQPIPGGWMRLEVLADGGMLIEARDLNGYTLQRKVPCLHGKGHFSIIYDSTQLPSEEERKLWEEALRAANLYRREI